MLLLAACGDARRAVGDVDEVTGVALVGGSALERLGVMLIPRSGEPPELRSLADPARIIWRGREELPVAADARAMGSVVVLRTPEGSVYTFDPDREILREVGTITGDVSWSGSGEAGVYYTSEQILAITEREGRLLRPETGRILWASPASGSRVVALVDDSGSTGVLLWSEDGAVPEPMALPDAGAPGLVTAWGRELVLSSVEGSGLVRVSLPRFESVERTSLDAHPFALVASPSSHRIYAAGDEAGLLSLDRFSGETREHGRFDAPVREVRPSVIGDYLLVFDGAASWALPAGSDDPVPLDTEWRSDLPLGLPGGQVVLARGGSVWVWSAIDGSATPLDAPADAWWLPVSWAPDPRRLQLASQAEADGSEEPGDETSEEAGVSETGEDVEVTPGLGGLPAAEAEAAPADDAAAVVSVPAGFYAVAASSQRAGGVHELSEALEGDGYPATVVPRRDEANEIWYRVMVGPYDSRDEAEAVVIRLRRERGIQAWVREVGSDGLSSTVGGVE